MKFDGIFISSSKFDKIYGQISDNEKSLFKVNENV